MGRPKKHKRKRKKKGFEKNPKKQLIGTHAVPHVYQLHTTVILTAVALEKKLSALEWAETPIFSTAAEGRHEQLEGTHKQPYVTQSLASLLATGRACLEVKEAHKEERKKRKKKGLLSLRVEAPPEEGK